MNGFACDSCAFWTLQPNLKPVRGQRIGLCRRHAPFAGIVGGRIATRWPLAAEDQWCGDHAVFEAGE